MDTASRSRLDSAVDPRCEGWVRAFVALGSNQGDRAANLCGACRALEAHPEVRLLARSHCYETRPVGPGEQGPYLNAAIEIETRLAPQAMLALLLAIELEHGRDRGGEAPRWGPRPLDLDLLLMGEGEDACLDSDALTLPHPRLHERAFVLEPLCELAASLRHPRLGEALEVFRQRVSDPSAVRRLEDADGWRSGRS